MSKIKLKHSSGNSMSIGAPATNPASDLELKLPATVGTAGQVLMNSSTAGTLEFGDQSEGITEFDMWRVNSNFTAQNTVVTANWERTDTDFEKIGTGLTESSGIFTFPSTGKYLINYNVYSEENGGTRYHGGQIDLSTDSGSNYTTRSEALINAYNTGANTHAANSQSVCFDITNVSTYRMRFAVTGDSTISYGASTNQQRFGFTCMKLGDT
jgi:hypothetical protein